MKVQILNDIIVAYGYHLFGDDIYDAPDDYTFEKYSYSPNEDGTFNPDGFTLIQ